MKINTLSVPLFALILFSCKEKKEVLKNEVPQSSTTDTLATEQPAKIPDTVNINKIESKSFQESKIESDTAVVSFNFDKFSSTPYQFTKKAKLDFSDDEGLYNFRTRIRQAYESGTPDFASYYITVIFGCGTSCIMGMMMDVRDGKIYGLPLGEETSCLFTDDRAIFDTDSRLFIASIYRETPEAENVYYNAFVWNERKKIFEKADEKEIK
ncbi:MAG: hypothetical protein LBE92_18895 [Chryseobacterium sp.]|jgi:hypothetical protein|uniref:hypothetical protein n=1 Tax=Chryseobacterium sp. TaxID=1871047 RepID=UPI0028388D2B|nr:hypothetical protein [Chryseobacterium sp.]MDR2238197.1 hypothetical protein [Chryseobacterium sp.]